MGKTFYKKKTGFVEKTVGDEMVIVPLVGAVAQMEKVFSLNELGSFIYNHLSSQKSTTDLIKLILSEFEIDEETANKDLEHFLKKAVESGIIEEL
ncbi:PqqD family protein [Carboxylicivirga marina]|uniref:PqqD family protein n=1 Tax=Carboxylicivirga marina TaxID=2800988 RepID=UPI0025987414|nr:PqqD family protein [uncultured Carboxylicivirga sp.]